MSLRKHTHTHTKQLEKTSGRAAEEYWGLALLPSLSVFGRALLPAASFPMCAFVVKKALCNA